MKQKVLLSFFAICLLAKFSFSQEEDNILKLKGVIVEGDHHEKITWVKSKPTSLVEKDFTVSAYDCSYIQLYFGLYLKDSIQMITPIRIVNTYKNSDWIFFDEISYLLGSRKEIRAGKGKVFKLYDNETRTKVENGVSEKSDIIASNEILSFIKYIIDTPVTRMECRYVSRKNSEYYTLVVHKGTKTLKKHFTAFFEAYNQTTAKFSLVNQFDIK